jgi:hypothetical protein
MTRKKLATTARTAARGETAPLSFMQSLFLMELFLGFENLVYMDLTFL